ncbi:chemotaxis protein CheD [Clostridium aminobutyricum]|uniref:Probable chemoreceptor glutamine deamidase CheD n=1 Tax=Clostridium aminobutyricum TaxID=33953 RepID=A0A939D9S2_CLOAM|nr:chemotaxis protein CheD [Clostridium aminobutyricum]MBN7773720.1 chemotaxis protein CheD [Clostridium aminobutyricum]
MSKLVTVGIAEMGIATGTDQLVTYALGSCIGVCLFDKNQKIAGMVHIMLPTAPEAGAKNSIYRYADTGVPTLLQKMESMGAKKVSLTAKIAGGAKMFDIPGDSLVGNIGDRNITAVKSVLATLRIPIIGEDVGSNYARTMFFNATDGMVTIKAFSRGMSTW